MRHVSCNNGTLVGTEHYSSPLPWIGLYIAAASLVCMLLMIYDIFVGIRSRKQWLPCKLFQLNSVTLALLSVVVKLPVDLTSPMPSSLDQASKLSGTAFLCIYMCYIMPSIRVMNDWTNMYALSILVITVFVDICLQLFTGVIVLFVTQHIIMLCCLLVLLLLLWSLALGAIGLKDIMLLKCKSYFRSGTRGGASFLQRLKVTYLYSFRFNPQFMSLHDFGCQAVGMLSIVCSVSLIWASVPPVVLRKEELCTGASDYDWSMGTIVVIQILGVTIGSLACLFRVMAMLGNSNIDTPFYQSSIEEPYNSNPLFWGVNVWIDLRYFMSTLITLIIYFALVIPLQVLWIPLSCTYLRFEDDTRYQQTFQGFEDLIYDGDMGFNKWTLRKCVEEMKRTIEASANDAHRFPSTKSPLSLILQSHKAHCTGNTYETPRPRVLIHPNKAHKIPLRLLPLVLLVRIAEVSLPSNLSQPLVLAFKEVFEILYFIEKHNGATLVNHVKEIEVARNVWMAHEFRRLLPETFHKLYKSDLERAYAIMEKLKSTMPPDIIGTEISFLVDFIKSREYSTEKALYAFVQDLFVDSLEALLAQLQRSIFIAVYGSPVEEFEERVRHGLKYLCKFETWDGLIWEPPIECNISSLLPTGIQAEAADASNVVPQFPTQPACQHENNPNSHEIVQIE